MSFQDGKLILTALLPALPAVDVLVQVLLSEGDAALISKASVDDTVEVQDAKLTISHALVSRLLPVRCLYPDTNAGRRKIAFNEAAEALEHHNRRSAAQKVRSIIALMRL